MWKLGEGTATYGIGAQFAAGCVLVTVAIVTGVGVGDMTRRLVKRRPGPGA